MNNNESRIIIDNWLTRRGVKRAKMEAFGKAIGLSVNQARLKYNEPERLTVKELRRMRLSDAALVGIVKGVRVQSMI